jgi:hypothetical protein
MPQPTIDLKDYRQPMVTSLGVILGFLVGFLGQWVTEDNFALKDISDYIVFVGCFLGAFLLFIALFKMLKPNVAAEQTSAHYSRTLNIYMVGVIVAFGSILIAAFL